MLSPRSGVRPRGTGWVEPEARRDMSDTCSRTRGRSHGDRGSTASLLGDKATGVNGLLGKRIAVARFVDEVFTVSCEYIVTVVTLTLHLFAKIDDLLLV